MKNISLILFLGLLCSCNQQKYNDGPSVLSVDLDKKTEDFHVLFDSVKVTLLETTDKSLLGYVDDLYDLDSLWIMRDRKLQTVKAFDKTGKFLYQYGAVGEGPGEYPDVYDIGIDKQKQQLILLPPWGEAQKYTVDGQFLTTVELPPAPSYSRIFRLNDDRWVIWSIPTDKESVGFQVLDNDFNVIYTGQPFDPVYSDLGFHATNFSRDRENLYIQGQFSRQVYEIGPDSLSKAYIWDFGDYNVKEEAYKAYSDEPVEDPTAYFEKQNKLMTDKDLEWRISQPANNKKYRHIAYVKSAERSPDGKTLIRKAYPLHVFFDKESGESIVVNRFSQIPFGGSRFLMDDEKVTYIIKNEDIDAFRSFAINGNLLEGFDPDESNPVLATFYFKK